MSLSDLMIIPGNPFLSGLVVFAIVASFLYMARESAHGAIRSFSRMLHNAMRLSAFALERFEKRLALRNKEVLLSVGKEAAERAIEREFERIDITVKKELADSPSLNRKLLEEITTIEEAFKESADVPPSPPGWVDAVEAVAKIPAKGDPVVVDILEDIHDSLVNAHKTAIEEYRAARKEKHQILKSMMPSWRKVLQVLDIANNNVTSLLERTKVIEHHMEEYEQIMNGTDRAVRMLSSSSLNQFFLSAFVLMIAVGGAMINFHLIARPMAEMVGGTSYLFAGYKTADVAALVIILVEITMGLFLMESLRVTRLFPAIASLQDKMRVRMIWITFGILFSLATVEAGLAYMRDLLAQDGMATNAFIFGGAGAAYNNEFIWITTVAQMGMGFILPFALTFVAIPLETFVQSTRTVLGVFAMGAIRAISFSLRLLGNAFSYLGLILLHTYDLLVFAPLWIEYKIKNRKNSHVPSLIKGERRKVEPPELVKEAS